MPFRPGVGIIRRDMRRLVLFLFFFLFHSHPAEAIINVEDAAIGGSPEGVHGRVDMSVSGNSGNSDKFGVQAGALLQRQRGRHVSIGMVSYAYGRSQGRSYANRGFFHARHRLRLSGAWSVEEFGQVEKDDFARLSLRALAGGGMRWRMAYVPERRVIYLGFGAMFEHERLRFRSGTSDARLSDVVRGNAYMVFKSRMNAHTRLISTTYIQPDLASPKDVRLLEQASLDVRLTGELDVRLSLVLQHDSRPPQRVRKTDIIYASGLTYHF